MGIIEEINKMVEEGRNEDEINASLLQRGYSQQDVANSISQYKIKRAVYQNESATSDYSQEDGLQSSVMDSQIAQPSKPQVKEEPPQYPQEQFAPQQPQYQDISSETQYNNADIVSEIAEQIVNEKMMSLKSSLEAIFNMKTTLEAKIESMDERLTKIEKTIDRLQLSILQKVGEYITNVEDIKKEMIDSQKTFKSLLEQRKN